MFDIIIHADDVVRRRGYCDHFVTMRVCVCVCVCVCVSMIKRKPLIGMTRNHTCNEKKSKIILFYFYYLCQGTVASPASGHVGTCPPWRLREKISARLYVVWFGMVLCKTLNLEYICSAVFVLE